MSWTPYRPLSGDAFLEIHPDYRHLEAEILAWAEANIAISTDDGKQQRLHIFAQDYDIPRQRLLEQRGYEKQPWLGVTWKIRLGERPYPSPPSPPGYHIRSTTPDDYRRIADALNAGFGRDFHTADEVGYFMTHAPSFHHDLDLICLFLSPLI